MENTAQISAFTDISRFTAMRADARADGDAAFATVAKEFEALFIQLMLKAAREASVEGGLFNSRELKLYREMMDSQVALAMAEQGGLGFQAVLRDQLNIDPVAETPVEFELPQAVVSPLYRPLSGAAPRVDGIDPAGLHGLDRATQTATEFVQALRPLARDTASKLGLTSDVLIAQAALETGWGRYTIAHPDGRSSNNLFAIKAGPEWNGDSVDVQTLEFVDGRALKINARFRAYTDTEAALDDYVKFLTGQPRYAAALDHGGDPRKFVAGLARAGYATDPRYAEKILAIKDQISAQSTFAAR
jgi:peptidoglycan hydrolase FlgJ